MDKKMFISAMLITTVMLFTGGCGKQTEPVSAEPTETIKEAGAEECLEPTPSPTVWPGESKGSSEAPDNSENKVTAEDKAVAEGDASTKTESGTQPVWTAQPAQTTQPVQTTQPAQTAQPVQTTAPTQPPAPATPVHTHSWIEHTATKQVWVSNIVVVDDYAEQVVGKTPEIATCECGYVTDPDSIFEHFKACNVAIGSTYYTTGGGQDIIEQVKVGSHEEDHGYYEETTYVDYYYCECGETRN